MSWKQHALFQTRLDDDVRNHNYTGSGESSDPYIINFLPNDTQNPLNFPNGRKYIIALVQALSFFAVTFSSSVYASGILQISHQFHVSDEVAILGLALYVLGFALGPTLWSPMSEVYGRLPTFVVSYTAYVAFSVAAPFAPDITTLLVLRFFASAFGSSAQTNPGGIITDIFSKEERGPVMALFAAAPFLGPAFGPIVGGSVGEALGWRWILGVNAILSGTVWIAALLVTRETYAPVILRSRAEALSSTTDVVYVSHFDGGKPPSTLSEKLKVSFIRPWFLLFREPIVLLTGIYVSIIYATLYMLFAAIPIVFERTRGWGQGVGGLPFVGVCLGVMFALVAVGVDQKYYKKAVEAAEAARQPMEPEARLTGAMAGSIVLPAGIFLFAWTTYPSVPWIAPVIGITIFSAGLVMVFISLINYLIDTYAIYVASALAANTIMRSFFAMAFPLFTTQMYNRLGDQWASSIPGFLVVGCLPFPILFYKYGIRIRARCKYAAEGAEIMEMMQARQKAIVVAAEQKV